MPTKSPNQTVAARCPTVVVTGFLCSSTGIPVSQQLLLNTELTCNQTRGRSPANPIWRLAPDSNALSTRHCLLRKPLISMALNGLEFLMWFIVESCSLRRYYTINERLQITRRMSTRLTTGTTFQILYACPRLQLVTPIFFQEPSSILISNREERRFWKRHWFEIRQSYSYSVS